MPVIVTEEPTPQELALLLHGSIKTNVIVCSVLGVVIAALFVALRFYTRTRVVRVLGASDWALLASLVFSVLQSVFFIRQAIFGLGTHYGDLDLVSDWTPLQKSAWFTLFFYNIALFFVKVSFVLLYLKIFPSHKAQVASKIILGLVVLSGLWTIILTSTACIPLRAYWDGTPPGEAYCHGTNLWWVNTAFHVATDFAIWSMPVPRIWRVKMAKTHKIVLSILFSLGFVVAFISIIRVIYLADLHRNLNPDFAYVGARFCFLSVVELNAGIVVACLITLKPLVHKMFPNLLKFDGPGLGGGGPPTIGTRGVHRDISAGSATGKAEFEIWKMEMGRDPDASQSSSSQSRP